MLWRQEAHFDLEALKRFYRGKNVLITGAAGSVGSAISEALAEVDCASLSLLDHFDHGLLDVVDRVRRNNRNIQVHDVLCDIRDRERLQSWFIRLQPDVVIHAAALKHVHVGERHPGECVLTNLIGARNVLAAAAAARASDFMLVSTDKAASPVCVMGATKRLAELHLIGFQLERAPSMRMKAVRFGNVLGSQGSVAPRFAAQIARGGPVEITHPEMERFFMSSSEAVGLIATVVVLNDGPTNTPAIYYMEMGKAVQIMDLAKDMIEQSGRRIEIEFSGLRPGEKLKETMYDEYEDAAPSALDKIHRVTPRSVDAYLTSADVTRLENLARSMDDAVVRQQVFAQLDACLGRREAAAG